MEVGISILGNQNCLHECSQMKHLLSHKALCKLRGTPAGKGWFVSLRSLPLPDNSGELPLRAQGSVDSQRYRPDLRPPDTRGTCDLVLPKLIVFVRLLQGLDG